MKRHQPVHIYLDNQIYFMTSHVYKNSIILDKEKKLLFYKKLWHFLKEFGFEIFAYVILNDHYHLLFKTRDGKDLPRVIGNTHGGFSFEVNTAEDRRGRKIWQNYWDRCIRTENDFWTHFNYIHHNPVKHGLVTKMEDYEFSTYNTWVKKRGEEWMLSIIEQYPMIDFSVSGD